MCTNNGELQLLLAIMLTTVAKSILILIKCGFLKDLFCFADVLLQKQRWESFPGRMPAALVVEGGT